MKTSWITLSLLAFLQYTPTIAAGDSIEYNQEDGRGLSVYRIVPAIDGPVLGIAAAGAAVPLFFESSLVHPPQSLGNPHDINFIDRTVVGNNSKTYATISHVSVALAIITPLALDLKDQGWNKVFGEDFMVYAQVLAVNSAVSNIARYSVQRPRPDVYSPGANTTDPGEYLSFYSGHVASTVAALSAASMTYGYRYGNTWWPWAITFAAGTAEAAERSMAGRHYYSDDLVGAIVGTALGISIPILHRRKKTSQVTIIPSTGGAELVWHKAF